MAIERRPRRWFRARCAVAVFAGVILALGVWPMAAPVHADSPILQTWWTVNNLTVELPVPPDVVAPGAVPPVTIPTTDVPDGGSEIAGTTDSPTGALTLRYEFPDGSALGRLVLTVADSAAVAPGTELLACALAGDGTFESHPGGGPIAQLPEHDCADAVPGVLDEEATAFTFDEIGSLAAPEHLSVVILPVAARVVLERALSDSLPVDEPERDLSPPALRPSTPPAAPAVSAPKPFLGQVSPEVATPPAQSPAPAAAMTPEPGPQEVATRLVTVFRGTPAGQRAGSAAAGTVLLLLAAGSVWRRGRAALDLVYAPAGGP